MNRRFFISTLTGLPFVKSARAAVPWSAKFVTGGFDGKAYQAGLFIKLDKGWKTYWRNPGESGIPPNINATGDNLESFSIDFPLPIRIKDESGETLGFHVEVMFLLNLKPKDLAKPLDLQLTSFFGVCEKVCTPAKFDGVLNFAPDSAPSEAALISQWQQRVPKPTKIVTSATVKDKVLTLDLAQTASDIFVEGPENYYFRAPKFNADGTAATFAIDGLQKPDDLNGVNLRITLDVKGQGLEQQVTVA
jgi:DsbC/DsbD-like thiol-disulfide interchange protein